MSKKTPTPEAKILAVRQQLQQLQALRDNGSFSPQAHAEAKAPLERQLVDLVMANADAGATPAGATPAGDTQQAQRPSKTLVASLMAGVLALAAAGYSWTGSPGATRVAQGGAAQPDAAESAVSDEQQFAAAVEKLAQRLKDQPDNAEGWAMLARSYARLGKHAEAVPAFVKALALNGTDARLLADYADTLAVHNGRSLEGEPLKLVERALQLDPKNPKALALAGTAAFDRRDFKEAVRHWETLATVLPADNDFLPQLQASIAEARQLAGMPKAQPASQPTQQAAASGSMLQGTVRLSPKLVAQAAPTDTVFIYARAAEGPRMPLAILRHQVKDLPIAFSLDDSSAMAPAMRLSLHPQVVVSARISKSGQATPMPGDLTGQSAPVANTASGVLVEIADVVKP